MGASGSVWRAGGCLCWCETGEAGRLNPPAPTAAAAEKCAGCLFCEGLCAGAGAGAVGAAVADSDSLPSSRTRLLALAALKLLFLEPPYWSVLAWLPPPPWAPRVWIWAQPKPELLLRALPEPAMVGQGLGQYPVSRVARGTVGMRCWTGCAAVPAGKHRHGAVTPQRGWLPAGVPHRAGVTASSGPWPRAAAGMVTAGRV